MDLNIKTLKNTTLKYHISKLGYYVLDDGWNGVVDEEKNIQLIDTGWELLTPSTSLVSPKFYISKNNGLICNDKGVVYKIDETSGNLTKLADVDENAVYSEYRDEFYLYSENTTYNSSMSCVEHTPIFKRYYGNNYTSIIDGSTNFQNAAIFGNAKWTASKPDATNHPNVAISLSCDGIAGEGNYFVGIVHYGDYDGSYSDGYWGSCGWRIMYSTDGSSWTGKTIRTKTGALDSYVLLSTNWHSANNHYLITAEQSQSESEDWTYYYGSNPANFSVNADRDIMQHYNFIYSDNALGYVNNLYYKKYESSLITSTNGFATATKNTNYMGSSLHKIEYINNLYYCLGTSNTYGFSSTSDFNTYTYYTPPANIRSWVGYHNSRFYAYIDRGLVYKNIKDI